MSEERRDAGREPGEPGDRPVGPAPGDAGDPDGTTSGAAPADPWVLARDRRSPADRLPPGTPAAQPPEHTGPADPFATPPPAQDTVHAFVPVSYAPLPAYGTPHSGPVTRPVPPPPLGPEGPGAPPAPYPFPGAHPPPVHPYAPGPGWRAFPPPPNNSFGLTAQILGIVSLGVWLWPVTLVTGVLALVYGGLARSRVAKGLSTNPGQARAGMICGAVGLLLAVGLTVAIVLVEGR
ncbi:hypothetical protein ACFV0R_01890 [Streptomyces sp. NPDC059578]|uniref:DUF4190 domain-containing protein n=1 Tax=Streptomyces sp. NPDC059578 TaxID=3346874 RepID=UPI0036BDFD2D